MGKYIFQPIKIMVRKLVRGDPRDASNEHEFKGKPASDEDQVDFYSTLALFCGLLGVTMRMKLLSWLGIIASISSIVNTKTSEYDTKSILTYFLFSSFGLVMNYFGPKQRTQ
jgi:hypothetical protein